MKYLLVVALSMATSFSFAQEIVKKPVRYIRVMGHAEQYYEPTYVDVHITLSEKEKVNNNNYVAEKERDLLAVLKEFNIDPSKLRVQQFNTGEAYSVFGSRYQVNKQYTLRIEDLKRYESIIVRLVEKDFKQLYVGEYGIADKAKRMDELMAEAVKNGAGKASIIATAANTKGIRLLSVDETHQNTPIPYDFAMARESKMMASGAADAAVNMQLGKIFMQKDLTMVYEIE